MLMGTRRHTLRAMPRKPNAPADANAAYDSHAGLPNVPDDSPRRRGEGTGKQVPFKGSGLVAMDPDKEPWMIDPEAKVGVKIELKGWNATEAGPKVSLKRAVPVEVVSTDFKRDDLHRLYGPFNWFCQVYTLSATGGLAKPGPSRMVNILACEFDDPDFDNDPEYEEDDVGTTDIPNVDGAKQDDPVLRAELRRRARRRHEIDNGIDPDEEEDEGDHPDDRPRSFGERDRGVRGKRGHMPMGRGGGMGGRPRPMEQPDWLFDPTYPTARPMPGTVWCMGGNPPMWQQVPDDGRTPPAPVTAPVAPVAPPAQSFLAGMDPDLKGVLLGVFGAFAKKLLLDDKPVAANPVTETLQTIAALNKPVDPIALEEARARIAGDQAERDRLSREAIAREAAAQRAHEIAMANAAREAAAKAESDKEERMVRYKQLGLLAPEGPTPAQIAAQTDLAVMKMRLEMMGKEPKQSELEVFEKIKGTLSKFGVKVGEGDGPSVADMLDTPAAKAMAENLAPAIGAILMKFAGATPPPVAQQPVPVNVMPADPMATLQAARQLEADKQQVYNQGRQHGAQEVVAQLGATTPTHPQEAPPAEQPTFGPESHVAFGPAEPVPQAAEAPPAAPPVDNDAALVEAALRARTVSPAAAEEASVPTAAPVPDDDAALLAAALAARTKAPESPEERAAREEREYAALVIEEAAAERAKESPADA